MLGWKYQLTKVIIGMVSPLILWIKFATITIDVASVLKWTKDAIRYERITNCCLTQIALNSHVQQTTLHVKQSRVLVILSLLKVSFQKLTCTIPTFLQPITISVPLRKGFNILVIVIGPDLEVPNFWKIFDISKTLKGMYGTGWTNISPGQLLRRVPKAISIFKWKSRLLWFETI